MTTQVPTAIQRFVDATNAGDTDAFLAAFTEDAFLSDWGSNFSGRSGIARWNQTDNIGKQSRMRLVAVEDKGGTWQVRIAVTGNGFNGEGGMAFTLVGDRISRLVIS